MQKIAFILCILNLSNGHSHYQSISYLYNSCHFLNVLGTYSPRSQMLGNVETYSWMYLLCVCKFCKARHFMNKKHILCVKSNLCTTTTLGTPKKWPLFRGGCYSEVPSIDFGFLGIRLVVVDRWPLFGVVVNTYFMCIRKMA